MHSIYLVRHGIYDRDTSATDDRVANGLNAQGHEQAKLVGARLAGLPVKMTHLVSSEFLRAAQTADDIAPFVKLTPTRGRRACSLGNGVTAIPLNTRASSTASSTLRASTPTSSSVSELALAPARGTRRGEGL